MADQPRTLNRGLVLLALAALGVAASSAGAAPRLTQPLCLEKGDGATAISFRAGDGARLRGILFGKGTLGVVLAHQTGSDACEWYEHAQSFVDAGYAALAIDFRGFGLSPTPPRPLSTTALPADVAGASAELRRRGAKRVVAIGSSLGGTAVLVAGANRASRLAGVVSLSAPGKFYGMDALTAAKRLTLPVRLLAARADGRFPDDARALAKASPSKDEVLLILPGGAHGTSLLENTLTATRARAAVLTFLRRIASKP